MESDKGSFEYGLKKATKAAQNVGITAQERVRSQVCSDEDDRMEIPRETMAGFGGFAAMRLILCGIN